MGRQRQRSAEYESFQSAFRGIGYTIKTQRHFRFHLVAGTIVMLTGAWLGLEPWKWAILLLTISSVLTAEAMNTAVEMVVDLAEPDFNVMAGLAKDVAAGAVIVTAIIAVAVGVIIFGPYLLEWLF